MPKPPEAETVKPKTPGAPLAIDAQSELKMLDVRAVQLPEKVLPQPHIRIYGKGRGALNRAASIQLGNIAQDRKLDTDTPRGALLGLDAVTGNPVVIPTAVQQEEGVKVNWERAGRRAFLHIEAALTAWNRVIGSKGSSVVIPTEVVPTARGPVLMLRWDQRSERAVRHRHAGRGKQPQGGGQPGK